MAAPTDTSAEAFAWQPQPEAAGFVNDLVERLTRACPPAEALARQMRDQTGTRLIDWLDHIGLAATSDNERTLAKLGFVRHQHEKHPVWEYPQGLFPTIRLNEQGAIGWGLRVESVADFLVAHGREDIEIEGEPLAPLSKARLFASPQAEFWVVERHGTNGLSLESFSANSLQKTLHHAEAFRRRARRFDRSEQGFEHASKLVEQAVNDVGVDRACDLFFAAEREYWQCRNRAAQIQIARQDRLGLGWANHDHHTYRSSRRHFTRLIAVLEQLGFQCRERFYGGHDAGWGAQVLEQPACQIVIFADVDLSPEEVVGDFAHEPLPVRDQLGTVGLWCELHGEAFLEAGMHHLECRFDFDRVREQLGKLGIESMKPFTELPYLKQAFTKADPWPVESRRIEAALAEKLISREQADRFREHGALGSHLEILQRDDGYKGFNQSGINEIIRDTDPRLNK